jgi:hypothetical protein
MAISVSFNGTSLQSNNILMADVAHDEQAHKKIARLELARGDGSKITNIQYTHKQVSLTGRIIGTSVLDLKARLDALKAALTGQDKNLDVDEGDGVIRRYVATLEGFTATRAKIGPNAAEIMLSFLIPTAFATDSATTTIINAQAVTTSPANFTPTFAGTIATQQPILTLTLTTIASTGYDTVSIGNSTSGQIISISRTWANGDVMAVDCFAQSVLVNSVATDYMGAFPSWTPGSGSVQVTDTFSSRSALLTATNLSRYL